MSFVQFEYSYKRGKIVIQGEVDSKTLQYIRLLKGINQRFYLDKVIDFFIRLFHYENQQLGSILIILLSILSTQMMSHFFFNTMVQQGLSHLTLCGVIVFIVAFQILMSTKYRMYVIGVLEIVLGMGVGAKYLIGFEDQDIILVFLVVNSLCLCLEILRKVLETEIQESILTTFNFESNFLIGVYVLGKVVQVYYPFLINHSINPYQLIPVIVCMSVINSVKIWLLFDFNVMYLISLITSIHSGDSQQLQKLSYFQYFLLFKQDINNKEQLNTKEGEQIKECMEITLGKESSMISENKESQLKRDNNQLSSSTKVYTSPNPLQTDSMQQSINLQSMNSSSLQQLNSNLSTEQQLSTPSPYTNNIWIAFAFNFTLSSLLILLIVYDKFSHNQLYIMSLGIFKALIIMLYCQHYTVIMTQTQTNSYSYLAYIISDLFMAAPIIMIILIYDSFQITNNNYNTTTLILHALIPYLTKTLYKELSQTVNITQSNTPIQHFFFIWVFLLSSKQTIVITFQSSLPSLYFVIDSILLLYALAVVLVISKVQFYQWLWTEFRKLKQMKKYKLYIIQSMRNWRFDIRQVSQTLFIINLNILFIGYVLFKPYQQQSCKYETEYLIVFGSAVLIHFLNSYNNYYTQQQSDHQSTPSYSPYYNYGLLVAASTVYASFEYIFNSSDSSDYDNHKRWSLLCLLLILFIVFTKIFGHQVYQTFPHFRSTIKLIELILSYFLFYYPFITIFTVFYFNFNMQSEYIFYFAVVALGYLTIASIIICVFVHAILNLTEKSKRTLFLINQFSKQYKKINMKEDSQFLSMLENLYDLMDGDSEKLLEQLKSQKISKIVIHDDVDFEYDYSFVQADNKQMQHEYVKVFADNMKAERGISSRKTIKLNSFKQISTNKKLETRIQFYKQTDSLVKGSKFRKSNIQNKNQLEVKRLIQVTENVYNSQSEIKKVKKAIDESLQFVDILMNEAKCRQMMHRFFHFLSDPTESLDFSTFCLLNQLLRVNQLQDMRQVFDRFSSDGESMNEQGFRDFLVDLNNQCKESHPLCKWFLRQYLFVFLMNDNDMFGYQMRRKSIQMSVQIDKIWSITGREQDQQKMIEFRKKQNIKKSKALGRKVRESKDSNIEGLLIRTTTKCSQNPSPKYKQQSNKVITHLPNSNHLPSITRKTINFLSPSTIYSLIVSTLIQTLKKYQQIEHQHFKLSSIRFSLSNVLCILTKLFDFTFLYTFGSIYTIYCYGIGQFTNNKHILSFMDYNYLLLFALIGVVVYIGLILYHKEEIVNGSLGVDQNQRTVSFTTLKYYTTFLLFLMGSSLSNLFITATLNSYMCDQSTNTLFNFPNNQCFSFLNVLQMFTSLIILLSYYPLASLIFPFSSSIDRTLQIKYKAQYEILYLQAKFLVNAINVVFNQLDFQNQELIKCSTKTIVALALAVLFYKEKPCSVQFINTIQLRIYIGTVIINGAGVLCYFIGMKFTSILAGVILFIYLIYSFVTSGRVSVVVDTNNKPNQQFDSNTIVESIFKNQQTLKTTLQKQNNSTNNEIDTASQLNKLQQICAKQIQQSQVHFQLKQTPQKFFNVQNLTTSQASISLPSKTKNNKITLRFKKQKTLPSTSNNRKKTLFPEDHIELIPASKKLSATLFSKLIGSKVNTS